MIRLSDPSVLDDKILYEVEQVLKSGNFVNGKFNSKFAELWALTSGGNYCVPTSSGMSALISTLKSIKSKKGLNHVVIPTLSFAATAFAVIEAGCIPIYCSIDKNGLMNQEHCLDIIDHQDILAVMPVHLYGQVLKIKQEILDAVWVIEDACQAHGSKLQGDAACFSFYPSKNLGTCGQGGAVVTNNEGIYEYVLKYINYGAAKKYEHEMIGNNLRMGEIEACVLYQKLKSGYLESEIPIRKKQAACYRDKGICSYSDLEDNYYHLYPILVQEPIKFEIILRELGIETGRHYPYTLPDIVPGYKPKGFYNHFYDYKDISRTTVSLPIGSHLLDEHLYKIAEIMYNNFVLCNNTWGVR